MCHFITAALPDSAPLSTGERVAARHGRRLVPIGNPSVQRVLGDGLRYFLTTPGHCDCDTALGALDRRQRYADDPDQERRRLLRKGWSAAKIERALAQKRDARAASDATAQAADAEALRAWSALIDELLASGATAVYLLLHNYSGPLDEDIVIRDTERHATATPEGLGHLREDVLHVFVARG